MAEAQAMAAGIAKGSPTSLAMIKSLLLLVPSLLVAQSPNVTGRWFAAADFYGRPRISAA